MFLYIQTKIIVIPFGLTDTTHDKDELRITTWQSYVENFPITSVPKCFHNAH